MLTTLINIGVFIIALMHFWFFILETFLWKKDLGMKIFKLEKEFAQRSAPLAANQGLYNLFLSAGLVWSVLAVSREALHLKLFFLSCVILAGIYGGLTVNKRIFYVQALPAVVVLILLILVR